MPKARISNRVGMPAAIYLELFGMVLQDAFGEVPFLVGTALETRKWRDVDVRMMLERETWDKWEFGDPRRAYNPKWEAVCAAFSELGKRMTGLPVDFQVQERDVANELYGDRPRMPIGIHRDIARYEREQSKAE